MFFKKTKIDFEKKLDEISFYIKNTNKIVHDLSYSMQEVTLLKTKIEDLEKQNIQLQKNYEEVTKALSDINRKCGSADKHSSESVWSQVFHDAIQNSEWLLDKKFFPGRWAVGYPAMYMIYRVLENFKPKSILELGLGQSTRVIGQYSSYNKNVKHIVCEQDSSWIEFFKRDFELPRNTKIQQLEYEYASYNDSEVRQYKNFKSVFNSERFNFIVIDAPLGGDLKKYSRVDVVQLMPQILEDDFVIIMDDYNRTQERNTIEDMKTILRKNNISFVDAKFYGQKETVILCSMSLSFLTSI